MWGASKIDVLVLQGQMKQLQKRVHLLERGWKATYTKVMEPLWGERVQEVWRGPKNLTEGLDLEAAYEYETRWRAPVK